MHMKDSHTLIIYESENHMSFAATINYWLKAQGYDGSGIQPLSDRFVMTDEERAAARRSTAIETMERSAYDMTTIRRAAEMRCDI